MSDLILIAMTIISSALATITIKTTLQSSDLSHWTELINNPMIWLSVFFYGVAFLFYIYALKNTSLSYAQPVVTSGVSVLCVLAAVFLFGEVVLFANWVGLILICFGIYLLGVGRI
jgi:multidrug transporter EmrE-like cation transporter